MSRSSNLRGYYISTVPQSAWIKSPRYNDHYGMAPATGRLYPFDKPYTNECNLISGCFKADPITKIGPRVCSYSCDNYKQYDVLNYMRGPAWNRSRY